MQELQAPATKACFVNDDVKQHPACNPTWTSRAVLRSVSFRLTAYRAVLTSALLLSITTRSMSLVGKYNPAGKHLCLLPLKHTLCRCQSYLPETLRVSRKCANKLKTDSAMHWGDSMPCAVCMALIFMLMTSYAARLSSITT